MLSQGFRPEGEFPSLSHRGSFASSFCLPNSRISNICTTIVLAIFKIVHTFQGLVHGTQPAMENRLLNKTPEGLPPHPRVENHDLEMQTGTLKEPALRRRFDTRDRKHDARARVLGCGGCGLGLLSGTGAFLLSLYLHVDFVPTWAAAARPVSRLS